MSGSHLSPEGTFQGWGWTTRLLLTHGHPTFLQSGETRMHPDAPGTCCSFIPADTGAQVFIFTIALSAVREQVTFQTQVSWSEANHAPVAGYLGFVWAEIRDCQQVWYMSVEQAGEEAAVGLTAGAAKGRTPGSSEIQEGLRWAARGCKHWKIRKAERAGWGRLIKPACQGNYLTGRQPEEGKKQLTWVHGPITGLCSYVIHLSSKTVLPPSPSLYSPLLYL